MGLIEQMKKNNDASITKHMIDRNEERIKNWIKPDDVVIVFRDAYQFLQNNDFRLKCPVTWSK